MVVAVPLPLPLPLLTPPPALPSAPPPPAARARGISAAQARQALVVSFGAEVVQQLGYSQVMGRIQADVERTLGTREVAAQEGAGGAERN